MKHLLLFIALLGTARTVAGPLPYPVILAPQPPMSPPYVEPSRTPSLEPSIRITPAPPVVVTPAPVVAVPVCR